MEKKKYESPKMEVLKLNGPVVLQNGSADPEELLNMPTYQSEYTGELL